MEKTIDSINEEDLTELTEVMTRSFDDDSQKHLGLEKGGPPGYDNGEFFKKWLFPYKETNGHKMVVGEKIVGVAIVWILPKVKIDWGLYLLTLIIKIEDWVHNSGSSSKIHILNPNRGRLIHSHLQQKTIFFTKRSVVLQKSAKIRNLEKNGFHLCIKKL